MMLLLRFPDTDSNTIFSYINLFEIYLPRTLNKTVHVTGRYQKVSSEAYSCSTLYVA